MDVAGENKVLEKSVPLLLGEGMTATCLLFLTLRNKNLQWIHPLTRISKFRKAQLEIIPSPTRGEKIKRNLVNFLRT